MKSVIGLLALIIMIVAGNLYFRADSTEAISIDAKNCDLQQSSCKVVLDDKTSIIFNILPKPVKANEQLKLVFESKTTQINSAAVQIVGTNMDMGILSYKLKPNKNNIFTSAAGLGICNLREMHWLIRVKVEIDSVQYVVNFNLTTN